MLPIRKVRKALVWLGKSFILKQIVHLNRIVMSGVFVLFVDAGYHLFNSHNGENKSSRIEMDAMIHSKLFYAQRNFYMTGFTLLLGIIIIRMQSMITKIEDKNDAFESLEKKYKELEKTKGLTPLEKKKDK